MRVYVSQESHVTDAFWDFPLLSLSTVTVRGGPGLVTRRQISRASECELTRIPLQYKGDRDKELNRKAKRRRIVLIDTCWVGHDLWGSGRRKAMMTRSSRLMKASFRSGLSLDLYVQMSTCHGWATRMCLGVTVNDAKCTFVVVQE